MMNWNAIQVESPAAFRCWSQAVSDLDLPGFLDSYGIYVLATYAPEHATPWGYEVYALTRFVREECRYTDRIGAEAAGFTQGLSELDRLINAGNR